MLRNMVYHLKPVAYIMTMPAHLMRHPKC